MDTSAHYCFIWGPINFTLFCPQSYNLTTLVPTVENAPAHLSLSLLLRKLLTCWKKCLRLLSLINLGLPYSDSLPSILKVATNLFALLLWQPPSVRSHPVSLCLECALMMPAQPNPSGGLNLGAPSSCQTGITGNALTAQGL